MKYLVHQVAILQNYQGFDLPTPAKDIKNKNLETYRLWKDDDIKELMKDNFEPNVLRAYMSLNGNALKADLARYCILYVYGGWYFDLLITADGASPYDLDEYEMLVFRDVWFYDQTPLPIANSAIWAKEPNHIVFKNAIDQAVNNVLSKSYPRHSHRIAGPRVFGNAVAKYCLDNPNAKILVGSLDFSRSGDLEFVSDAHLVELTISSLKNRSRVHFGWHRLPGSQDELPETYQKNSS